MEITRDALFRQYEKITGTASSTDIDKLYEIADLASGYRANPNLKFSTRARTIGNIIYDMSPRPTKLYSVEAVEAIRNNLEKEMVTKDHLHSRQKMAEQILNNTITNGHVDIAVLCEDVAKAAQTIVVTKQENLRLVGPQNKYGVWDVAYKEVGIELLLLPHDAPTRWKRLLREGYFSLNPIDYPVAIELVNRV